MNNTIAAALAEAADVLRENDVREARRDSQLLLGFVLAKDLTFLIAHDNEILSEEEQNRFYKLVKRRITGEPLQHILGQQEFYGLDFEVDENVLIPRPETEFLVEAAIEILRKQENQFFCDIGTGSGCIAVSIAKNVSKATGIAIDISNKALEVARRNAERNGLASRLCFVESNVFATLKDEKFSVIVSNPPYIPQSDSAMLQREVRDFEPHVALFGGADGLSVVEILLAQAPNFLIEKGFLLFEIGFTQSERVQEMIDENVWQLKEIRSDLQGIPRTIILQLN